MGLVSSGGNGKGAKQRLPGEGDAWGSTKMCPLFLKHRTERQTLRFPILRSLLLPLPGGWSCWCLRLKLQAEGGL